MSTNASIILRIKKEDKGRKITFDASKLPVKYDNWDLFGETMKGGCNKCEPIILHGNYIGIYNHWDGDTLIDVLKRKFVTYDDVLNLIAGGYVSFVGDDSVRYYANREENCDWDDIKPLMADSLKKELNQLGQSYNWVFEDDKWYSCSVSGCVKKEA